MSFFNELFEEENRIYKTITEEKYTSENELARYTEAELKDLEKFLASKHLTFFREHALRIIFRRLLATIKFKDKSAKAAVFLNYTRQAYQKEKRNKFFRVRVRGFAEGATLMFSLFILLFVLKSL